MMCSKENQEEGKLVKLTTIQGKKGLEIISEETGDSPKQVQRYIKMADLIPELLEKVDEVQWDLLRLCR